MRLEEGYRALGLRVEGFGDSGSSGFREVRVS